LHRAPLLFSKLSKAYLGVPIFIDLQNIFLPYAGGSNDLGGSYGFLFVLWQLD
jgi:hypothetical protein